MKNAITATELRNHLTYEPETGLFFRKRTQRRWKAGTILTGTHDTYGHIRLQIADRIYAAHRLAFLYMTGDWPPHDIDHINGIRDDNRWANLRPASRAENLRNMKAKPNKTGLKGVYFNAGKYAASIRLNYKKYYLGRYDSPEEAHAAYVAAAQRLHGKFANPG